jgi:hypothetical protein
MIFDKDSFLKLNAFFESLSIQKMTPLIKAAKKHQTDIRYCVKNIPVMRQEMNIRMAIK